MISKLIWKYEAGSAITPGIPHVKVPFHTRFLIVVEVLVTTICPFVSKTTLTPVIAEPGEGVTFQPDPVVANNPLVLGIEIVEGLQKIKFEQIL